MRKTVLVLLTILTAGGCGTTASTVSKGIPIATGVTKPTPFEVLAASVPKFKVTTLVTTFTIVRPDITFQGQMPWSSVAVSPSGKVFLVDSTWPGRRIVHLGANGKTTHFSGSTHYQTVADGGPNTAIFLDPKGLAFGPDGTLYVGDTRNIRKVDNKGTVTTLAGSLIDDVRGTHSGIESPQRITVRADGVLYALDANCELKKVFPNGRVESVVKSSPQCLANMAFDAKHGVLYLSSANQIFKVSSGGSLIAIAGKESGALGDPYADGKGKAVVFGEIKAITTDGDGNIFTAESETARIRMVTPSGQVTTVAGSGAEQGVTRSPDGPGLKARFRHPFDITTDKAGNIYVLDENGIRKLTRVN